MKNKNKFEFLTEEQMQKKAQQMSEPLRGKITEKVNWRSGDEEEVTISGGGVKTVTVIRRINSNNKPTIIE